MLAVKCLLCEVVIQPLMDGTLQDGVQAHFATIHPGEPVPIVEEQ